MMQRRFRSMAVTALAALVASAAAASADAGLSLTAGPAFVLNGGAQGQLPKVVPDLGLGIDFGPKTIVPVRVSLDLSYAGGSGNGGSLTTYGAGIGARLTTPLYVGVVLSAENVNVHPGSFVDAAGAVVQPPSASATGFGTSFFAGERLFGLPGGAGVSLEGTYRRVPSAAGYTPSTFTIGVRASL